MIYVIILIVVMVEKDWWCYWNQDDNRALTQLWRVTYSWTRVEQVDPLLKDFILKHLRRKSLSFYYLVHIQMSSKTNSKAIAKL